MNLTKPDIRVRTYCLTHDRVWWRAVANAVTKCSFIAVLYQSQTSVLLQGLRENLVRKTPQSVKERLYCKLVATGSITPESSTVCAITVRSQKLLTFSRVKYKDHFTIAVTAFDSETAAPVWVQTFMCINRASAGSKFLSVGTKYEAYRL
jgi:hypothetical protein